MTILSRAKDQREQAAEKPKQASPEFDDELDLPF
jgi:hypothetical protein